MDTALTKEDVQTIVKRMDEKFNLDRAQEIIATGKYPGKNPEDLIFMSAKMMTDKDGIEKFMFVVDDFGTLTMAPNDNGFYQLEKVEGNHQNALCVFFHAAVNLYAGKIWGKEFVKN